MEEMGSLKLNKEQLAAVRHKEGALLVVAGAGTGKTTVITERIKYLISEGLAKPSEILALTFTEKAAREMEERVDVAMPLGYTQMWISTFHSFCDQILRQEGLAVGIDTSYKLLTSAQTVQFIKDNLFEFDLKYFRPLGNPNKFIKGLLQHFSRLQDEDVSPSEYLTWTSSNFQVPISKLKGEEKMEAEKWVELANAYKTYEELKTREGKFDFGDLIVKTLKLFRERPNVLAQYQEKFKHILVDEYQDTNIAQNELVKLLSADDGNITVVLDDDQSVYRFRGAAVSNAIQFRKNFTKSKIVTLVKNYRTNQEILDGAYDLIQFNNPDRLEVVENIDKKLISQVDGAGEVRFIHADRVENEVEEAVEEIVRLTKKEGFDFKDIAILVRANNHAEPFIQPFKRMGIPHQFLGPAKLFHQKEIQDIISFLKVLYDMDDSVSFLKLISIDHFDIEGRDVVRISNFAKKYNLSIYETLQDTDDLKISKKSKTKLSEILELVEKSLSEIKTKTAGEMVYSFLQETRLIHEYLNPDSAEVQQKAESISALFDKLKSFESAGSDASVSAVVDWIDLLTEQGESPMVSGADWGENDAVNILTVHSSKGLEFPVVFLVNLVAQRFPSTNRSEQIPIPDDLVKEVLPEGDHHIQEERRLFYVGMTRAKQRLYLTAANYYGEAKRKKKLSPFIFEALGEKSVGSENLDVENKQLSFTNFKSEKPTTHAPQLITSFHVDYLSYSQIQTFQSCELHYKMRYILKVPTPTTAALSFGSSIHESMNDFYKLVGSGEKASKKLMKNLLDKNWIGEGFEHKKHEAEYRKKGEKYLSDYLKLSFDAKNLPIALEKSFGASLVSGDKVRLKIGGKIDRIDVWRQPASAKATARQGIEIIDYKTGEKVPDQKFVDKNDQLTFYALAVSKLAEPPFGKPAEEVSLSLYYFEKQKKLTTTRTAKQLKEFESKLFEIKEQIENSSFKCTNEYLCKTCEFKMMCGSN